MRKVVAEEVASHVNPKGQPLNATAMMAVVLRLSRRAEILSGCCNGVSFSSVVWLMVSGEVRSRKVGVKKSFLAGIGT